MKNEKNWFETGLTKNEWIFGDVRKNIFAKKNFSFFRLNKWYCD